jgi:AcrR family transcriptional regulator
VPEAKSDPGVTHRARKKQRTRENILANAISLFRSAGIRSTRSIEIAAASEVSPATLFNYFATKNDLAEAWVRGEIRDHLGVVARDAGDSGVRSPLRGCCLGLAEESCPERELRLEAWRHAGRSVADSGRTDAAIERVIGREQERGRLRADVSAVALAEMLGDALEGGLITGLRESDDPKHVAAVMRARIDLVLDGARKRNERVSPPRR